MSDILRLSAVFLFIVLLLRRKLGIGLVMLLGAGLLALLYLMGPMSIVDVARRTVVHPATLKLLLALSMIRIFELMLREKQVLSGMMEAAKALLVSRKAVLVSMPLLIGMLPSVGGAYFSAPMVGESAKGTGMSNEEKAFINYWYRHPWEFILPLYPGILLASAVSGIELWTLITLNLTYAVTMALTGFFFSMRGIGKTTRGAGVSMRGLLSFVPVAAVLLLVVLLRIELHIALILTVAGLFVFFRYGPKEIFRLLRYGFSPDVILLIIGVMLFKETMEASGAVKNLSIFFRESGVAILPMLFLLPFVTGLLTGLTLGFVGATFPLLTSLSGTTEAVSFAFASGFIGVLLSPVHVCLILTREYFKADMTGIYKRMLPAVSLVFIAALIQYFILR